MLFQWFSLGPATRIILYLTCSRICLACDTVIYLNEFLITNGNDEVKKVNDVVSSYGFRYQRHVTGRIHSYTFGKAPSESYDPVDRKMLEEIMSKAQDLVCLNFVFQFLSNSSWASLLYSVRELV